MNFNPGSFLTVSGELQMLGLATVLGALLGAVFDVFRLFRMSLQHKPWMVFVEDLLFTLLFGTVWFLFSVQMLEGQLRGFVLCGMVAGFGLYLLTIGRIIAGLFRTAGKFLRNTEQFVIGKARNSGVAKKFFGKTKKSS
ncbi:MAG: spore cortex biosynthesis protein YabQ [Oscillospiraceae bacterium]|nr:spore cortex biosynthesis protein YabQ [Ruminococcus sp.]MCD8345110.1 spore cortex biosynthesis protein YabQ [Oscillospiraceae bacterium]